MADTTLFQGDTRFNLNPDTGVITLHLGPITIKGFCSARISLTGKDPITVHAEHALEVFRDPVTDVYGTGIRLATRFADGAFDIGLRLEAVVYDNQPFVAMRVGVMNHGVERVLVHDLSVLETLQLEMGEDSLNGWVNGYHSWSYTGFVPHNRKQPRPTFGYFTRPFAYNLTTEIPKKRGQYVGEWVGALIDPEKQALVAGFVGVEDQFGQIYMEGRRRSKSLRMTNSTDSVPIISGELLWGEWAIIYRTQMPHSNPMDIYADAVTRLTPPRVPAPQPAPGWSSWYQFFDSVSAEDLERNQYVLRQLHDQLPLEVIQLDDGYQPAWGDWLDHNNKFPDGVAHWANNVRHDGLEPGLWLSPFTVTKNAAIVQDYPEALIQDDKGKPVNGGRIFTRQLYGLDPTHPATQDFVRNVVRVIVQQWGIRYLKLDFLFTGALPGLRHDPMQTRAQALRHGLSLIREAAGEDVTLLGCGCPLGPALGLIDIMRVSPDVAPYWHPKVFGMEWWTINDYSLPSARNSMITSLQRHWTHRRWWWMDADNLLVREEQDLTEEEVQTLTTVVGLTGSHLVISDDLPVTSYERLSWAANLLPIFDGDLEIPGMFESMTPHLIIKRFHGPAGPHTVAAFINWNDRPQSFSVSRADIGLPVGMPMMVFDYWNKRIGTTRSEAFETDILPAHGVALMSLRPMIPGPQLVGTDTHISMGEEITEWQQYENGLSFLISLNRKTKGSIWLKLPRVPTTVTVNGGMVKVKTTGRENIFRINVSIDGDTRVEIKY